MGRIWFWCVLVYYLAANGLVPRVSCQWPFNILRLWYFGLIPLAFAIVGLCVYETQGQRVLAWMVVALAIAGICISFQPWCLWLGLNTW
jgi:hypothetical protein